MQPDSPIVLCAPWLRIVRVSLAWHKHRITGNFVNIKINTRKEMGDAGRFDGHYDLPGLADAI